MKQQSMCLSQRYIELLENKNVVREILDEFKLNNKVNFLIFR